jgi:hypothetical protein
MKKIILLIILILLSSTVFSVDYQYWRQNENTSRVWIKGNWTTSSQRIYWSNTTSTYLANGSNVFVFFDDFTGSSLDITNKWSEIGYARGTQTVSDGYLTITGTGNYWNIYSKQINITSGMGRIIYRWYPNTASTVNNQAGVGVPFVYKGSYSPAYMVFTNKESLSNKFNVWVDSKSYSVAGTTSITNANHTVEIKLGVDGSGGYGAGYVDNVLIGSFNATHIKETLYYSAVIYYHGLQTGSKYDYFLQTKLNSVEPSVVCNSTGNYCDIVMSSGSVSNYQIKMIIPSTNNLRVYPNVLNTSFLSQSPSDINITNALNDDVNITYSITKDANPINTAKIFYTVNSTTDNIFYIINMTAYRGFQSRSYSFLNDTIAIYRLSDNDIYRGNYNYNISKMDDTPHNVYTLSTGNSYIYTELYNVTNTKQYGIFEIMLNGTGATSPINAYYCNSSYVSGSVLTSAYCSLVGTRLKHEYDHKHKNYSNHAVFSFPINVTSGKVGNTKVTPRSYFIVGGSKDWKYYAINGYVRSGMQKTTANRGISWTAQNAYIVDAHLHQFSLTANESLYYYSCVNDTSTQVCTSIRRDDMQLGKLPPSAVQVYEPTDTNYQGFINISYYPAISPNNYTISYYSIDLLNSSYGYLSTIKKNNSKNLNYGWFIYANYTSLVGTYVIRVNATDSIGQKSFGYSLPFNVTFTPTLDVDIMSPSSLEHVGDNDITFNVVTNQTDGENYCVLNPAMPLIWSGDFNGSQNFTIDYSIGIEGNNTVTIHCFTNIYYPNNIYQLTKEIKLDYFLDTTNPVFNITSPYEGQIYNISDPEFNISFHAQDTYLYLVDGTLEYIDYNGSNTSIILEVISESTGSELNFTLLASNVGNSGLYKLNISAYDENGLGGYLHKVTKIIYFWANLEFLWIYPQSGIINYIDSTNLTIYHDWMTSCRFNNSNNSFIFNTTLNMDGDFDNPQSYLISPPSGNSLFTLSCDPLSEIRNITFCQYTLTYSNSSSVCKYGFYDLTVSGSIGNCSPINISGYPAIKTPCDSGGLVSGRCPSNMPSILLLIAFLAISMIMVVTGMVLSSGIFSGVGSILMLFLSFVVIGCSLPIGLIILFFAIIGVAISVFGGYI